MIKNLKYLFLFVFCANAFAQKEYKFDYLSVYEFKEKESDSISIFEYSLGSIQNNNISLHFKVEKNLIISLAQLIDHENLIVYNFDIKNKVINDIPDFKSLFKNSQKRNLNLDLCRNKNKYSYKIVYNLQNNDYSFLIERYNKKGTKLIETSYYKSEKTDVTKNQIFSTFLKSSLHCNKFNIDFYDVITESYFVGKGSLEKYSIRKLVKFEKIDFIINTTN